jgi:predicted lysophospholipase L1 biosynthesis ABC-type transport system permease subunit
VLRPSLIGVVCGLVVGAIAGLISVAAAAGGHGTDVPAALLFPFSTILATWFGSFTPVAVAVALAQFPLYGLLASRWRRSSLTFCVAGVHILAIALATIAVSRSGVY